MSNITRNYFRNIFHQLKDKLADVFCGLVALGQEEQMKIIIDDEIDERNEFESTVLHLQEAFNSCTTRQARLSVLMLVPQEYSKLEVCQRFECTFYEIKKARSICKLYGACAAEPKHKRVYSRLSCEKTAHFIDFLFTTGLLEEMA